MKTIPQQSVIRATSETSRGKHNRWLISLVHWSMTAFILALGLYCSSLSASASELIITDTLPLTRTPWVRTLSAPQFDPTVGALQEASISLQVHLQGEGYYENRADVTSTLTFQHLGEILFSFDNGDEIGTLNTVAQSSLQVPPYDGLGGFNFIGPLPQDDEERLRTLFNGTSGGVSVANVITSENHSYTSTVDLQRFLGSDEIGVDVFADAESRANDTTGNVDYELRARAEAQLIVKYRYLTTDILLEKTVYLGHTDGAGCPGQEKVEDEQDKPITYCFKVTNTGETYLNQITISDTTLGITEQQMTLLSGSEPLAPQATMVFYVERILEKQLTNQAVVEGTPTDSKGFRVQGLQNPTDEDVAQVNLNPKSLDETEEPQPKPRIYLPLVSR